MFRLTRKVFIDLMLWMTGLGLLIGVIFPFFAVLMGIPRELVLTPWFFAACMAAGLIVGGLNIYLARTVVGRRLKLLAERMQHVTENLRKVARGGDLSSCRADECLIAVDSDDEIGESARSFNQLVHALSYSLETEAAVRKFTGVLSSNLDLADLADRALQQLLEHTRAQAGAILIEIEGEVKVAAAHGIRAPETLGASDHVRAALRTEQQSRIALPEGIIMDATLVAFPPREVVVDPISHKKVVLGAIVLAGASAFTDDDLVRLELFRQGLALALHNALLYDHLGKLAALDPLTGAYNRRFGANRLHEEFSRGLRMALPIGVLMLDLDHFKQINDTYGHLVGDRVLVRVARLARAVLRDGDLLVRYGGEEFLAVLPGASRGDLAQAGERLRRAVEDTSVADGEQAIRVTVSVGGASYPENDIEDENALVRQADQALYAAKESGRNRVVIAQALHPS